MCAVKVIEWLRAEVSYCDVQYVWYFFFPVHSFNLGQQASICTCSPSQQSYFVMDATFCSHFLSGLGASESSLAAVTVCASCRVHVEED